MAHQPRHDTKLKDVKEFIKSESKDKELESSRLWLTKHANRAIRELLSSGDITLHWSHLYDKHRENVSLSERPKVGDDMFFRMNRILNHHPYHITRNKK
jgi:hypothetical protein